MYLNADRKGPTVRRTEWGKYEIAGLAVNLRIVNGHLIARVGGGWMGIEVEHFFIFHFFLWFGRKKEKFDLFCTILIGILGALRIESADQTS